MIDRVRIFKYLNMLEEQNNANKMEQEGCSYKSHTQVSGNKNWDREGIQPQS